MSCDCDKCLCASETRELRKVVREQGEFIQMLKRLIADFLNGS